jgi:hypothetical protein
MNHKKELINNFYNLAIDFVFAFKSSWKKLQNQKKHIKINYPYCVCLISKNKLPVSMIFSVSIEPPFLLRFIKRIVSHDYEGLFMIYRLVCVFLAPARLYCTKFFFTEIFYIENWKNWAKPIHSFAVTEVGQQYLPRIFMSTGA